MSTDLTPQEFSDVLDDDALLDALGAGAAGDPADPVSQLFASWRAELDAAVPAYLEPPSAARRAAARWGLRRSAVAVSAALVVAAGTTTAAAAAGGPTGPLGPLHRLLFSSSRAHDAAAEQARGLLDAASAQVRTAEMRGWLDPSERTAVTAELDRAAQLLGADRNAPVELSDRLTDLRARLAALPDGPVHRPTVTPPVPVPGAAHAPAVTSGTGDVRDGMAATHASVHGSTDDGSRARPRPAGSAGDGEGATGRSGADDPSTRGSRDQGSGDQGSGDQGTGDQASGDQGSGDQGSGSNGDGLRSGDGGSGDQGSSTGQGSGDGSGGAHGDGSGRSGDGGDLRPQAFRAGPRGGVLPL